MRERAADRDGGGSIYYLIFMIWFLDYQVASLLAMTDYGFNAFARMGTGE
jgi:hypothetical protein